MACEYLQNCIFFTKYGDRKNIVWKEVLNFYCNGRFCHLCENRNAFLLKGKFPTTPIMPAGFSIPRYFMEIF